MGITTFAGEKQISELATRIFGDLKPAQRKAAEEALLRANPHLKTLQNVKLGAIVIVPRVPGLKPTAGAAGEDDPAAAGVSLVTGTLKQYQQKLATAAGAELQEVGNTSAQIKSADVKRIVKQFQLQAHVSRIAEANTQRGASAKEVETFAKGTIAEMQMDLRDLVTRLS
jgi:hypothetical protein